MLETILLLIFLLFALLPFGIARRMVLFVVASEIIQSRFVQLNATFGHSLYITNDRLVVGVLLVVLIALGAHIAGNVVDGFGYCDGIILVLQLANHTLDILAVMFVHNVIRRIAHLLGAHGERLARYAGIGRIDIELKIRHYEHMIPQLVGIFGSIAQQWIEITHNGDHGASLTIAFAAILDQQQRIDHLLNMTTIFGQKEFLAFVIIILFHRLRWLCSVRRVLCAIRLRAMLRGDRTITITVGGNSLFTATLLV